MSIRSPYVNKLVIKDKNNQIRHITGENRGLRKTIKRVSRASKNNHNGLMYWKNKYFDLITQSHENEKRV